MRKVLTKKIWSRLKVERKEREAEKLDRILEAGKGKKELASLMRAPVKSKRITAVKDVSG